MKRLDKRWAGRSRLWKAKNGLLVVTPSGLTLVPWVNLIAEVTSMCSRGLRGFPEADSRDAAHDVFVALLGSRFGRNFDGAVAEIRPYLAGVVRHVCGRIARRILATRTRVTVSNVEPANFFETPDQVAEGHELRTAIVATMPRLTLTERSTLKTLLKALDSDCGLPRRCRGAKWDVRVFRLRSKLQSESRLKQWLGRLAKIEGRRSVG